MSSSGACAASAHAAAWLRPPRLPVLPTTTTGAAVSSLLARPAASASGPPPSTEVAGATGRMRAVRRA